MPPYYYIALSGMDFFTICTSWVATITYAGLLAPPDLVATMTAMVNTLQFILCKRHNCPLSDLTMLMFLLSHVSQGSRKLSWWSAGNPHFTRDSTCLSGTAFAN
jgi:hypothetical protein